MSYVSEITADSPIAWYRCQEASGYLQDSSGGARHADEVHGSPTYAVTGPITSEGSDRGITFHSASSDWFNVPYYAGYDLGDVCSVECWLKRADTVTTEQIVITRDQGLYLAISGTNQLAFAKSGVSTMVRSTVAITDTTTWHHCVNTKTGATVKQYIDGVDVTGVVTNQTFTNGATPTVKIGADGGGSPFNGSVDEIAVYATALSAARVLAHYTAATAGAGGGGGGAVGSKNLMLTGVG